MNYLPTLRKLSAVLVLAGAGVSINALLGIAPAAGQSAPPAAAPPAAAPAVTPAGPTAGDPARGFRKAATCLGCHSVPGYKADFPTVYSVPMIGGQNAKYIENALKAYQKGERRFPSMIATARSLSDQDIADVAAFFSSQH
jgi:cytochrome c553